MIQRDWFRFYETLLEEKPGAKIFQSWDVAAKDGLQNDYSVCTTWLFQDKKYYLIDLARGRYDFPQRNTAKALADRYKPYAILIEDASAGISLAQRLRAMGHWRVKIHPGRTRQTDQALCASCQVRGRTGAFPEKRSVHARSTGRAARLLQWQPRGLFGHQARLQTSIYITVLDLVGTISSLASVTPENAL